MSDTCDIAIIGGGVIGSAIAWFLTQAPAAPSVALIEKDRSFTRASTGLSVGGIRQQFSTPENIAMSIYAARFVKDAPFLLEVEGEQPDLTFRQNGYLMLASEAGRETLSRNVIRQQQLGADIALLDPDEIHQRFDWLNIDGLACGALGLSGEGWIDPSSLLQALRRKARDQGCSLIDGEVTGMERKGGTVTTLVMADGSRLSCDQVVIAAGPSSGSVAGLIGADIPVEPRRRQVFVIDARHELPDCPLVVDPSGVYFRPEGKFFICGRSPDESDDLPGWRHDEVDHRQFEEDIWPVLAERSPLLEAVKVVNAWVGHYDYNPLDHNAIVGSVPGYENLFVASGFSGHGLQQAPAVGRAMAELLLTGGYRNIDLTRFAPDRFLRGDLVLEDNVV
jgi:sarcosine oxidase